MTSAGATGRVAEVIYAGPATRFVVDLDAGARLVAVQQNQQTSSADVAACAGKPVRLTWRAEHVVAVPPQPPQGRSAALRVERALTTRSTHAISAAPRVAAAGLLALAGCGDGGDGDSAAPAGGIKPPKIDKLAVARRRRGPGQHRRLGRATSRTAPPTRRSTGSPASRSRPAARSTSRSAGTSDEMVTLMKTGDYDVVSASGDASLRLIYGGDVAPVNTDLVPNYKDVFDGLKHKPWNSVDGVAVRHPARPRRQPAHVPHRHGHPGARPRGARCSTRTRRTRAR